MRVAGPSGALVPRADGASQQGAAMRGRAAVGQVHLFLINTQSPEIHLSAQGGEGPGPRPERGREGPALSRLNY